MNKTYAFIVASLIFIILCSYVFLTDFFLPSTVSITVKALSADIYQVFYNRGQGFTPNDSSEERLNKIREFTRVGLRLPASKISNIRIDPGTQAGIILIKDLCIKQKLKNRGVCWNAAELWRDFSPAHDISRFYVLDNVLQVEASGSDPYFEYKKDFSEVSESVAGVKKRPLYFFVFIFSVMCYGALRYYDQSMYVIRKTIKKIRANVIGEDVIFVRTKNGASQLFPLWLKTVMVSAAVIKLWLIGGQSVFAVGSAGHDDRLFLNLADSLQEFSWLGDYNNMTLAKGPFYPMWIAAMFLLGIPLLLSQHLLYISACCIFVFAARPILGPLLLTATYLLLLFNPVSFDLMVATRSAREGIYPALTLIVFSGAIGLLARSSSRPWRIVLWSVFLGSVLPAFWLTREEGIWIVPSVAFLIAFAVAAGRGRANRFALLTAFLVPFAMLAISVGIVAGINKINYGIFTTVEFKSPEFVAAYGALTRVKHAAWQPRIPVPKDVREKIYKVSPSFNELKPALEGDIGQSWTKASCESGAICYDMAGGWFMWALRDAVAKQGYYESGSIAAEYYSRLSKEVNAACSENKLDCGPERASMSPPWRQEYMGPFINTASRLFLLLSSFNYVNPYQGRSIGSDDLLVLFRDMTSDRVLPGNGELKLKGRVSSSRGPIMFSIHTDTGAPADAYIKLPISSMAKGAKTGGDSFEITTSCSKGCLLYLNMPDGAMERIPLDGSVHSLEQRYLSFYLDEIGFADKLPDLPRHKKMDALKLKLLSYIGKAFQRVALIFVGVAVVSYLFASARLMRRREFSLLWVINTALVIAVTARIMILSFISVSAFNAVRIDYLSPVYPLIIMFTVMSILDTMSSLKNKRYGNSGEL